MRSGEHLLMPMTGRKPVADDVPDSIDTSVTNDDPCDTADSTYGCLNGWQYNFKEQVRYLAVREHQSTRPTFSRLPVHACAPLHSTPTSVPVLEVHPTLRYDGLLQRHSVQPRRGLVLQGG